MADKILVNSQSMANGSTAILTATRQLRMHADDLLTAANQVGPMWSAQSHQAFRNRHANVIRNIGDIETLCQGHSAAVEECSVSTSQLDKMLAGQMERRV